MYLKNADDTQPENPNKTPKMSMSSIAQARGRLQGGLYIRKLTVV